MLALFRQDGHNLIDFGDGYQGPMRSAMAGLAAHFPSALAAPAALTRFTGQSIRGGRFGRVRGVLFAQRQLPLQIRDLLLRIGDLFLLFGNLIGLSADLLIPLRSFTTEPFVLPLQIVRRHSPPIPRTHPP